jgi:hypothetical protein
MTYMAQKKTKKTSLKQKNFTLPKKLIRAWTKFLPKEGSQESSKNGRHDTITAAGKGERPVGLTMPGVSSCLDPGRLPVLS